MNQIIEGIIIITCCLIEITYQQNEKHKRCIYSDREFHCPYEMVCCGPECCWESGNLFFNLWWIWLILGILVLLGCIVCAIKCCGPSKPSTPTQNATLTVTTQATANSGADTSTRHNVQNRDDSNAEMNFLRNFGQAEPLLTDFFNGNTNSNHNSNFITTIHHFDSSNPRTNYSTTATHYSGHDLNNRNTTNQNSTPRSRNQSGRCSPVPRPTAAPADVDVASDAPPSYFDAVYKGKGERTNTRTVPEL